MTKSFNVVHSLAYLFAAVVFPAHAEGPDTEPGNYPLAHRKDSKGKPWAINIDGSPHDAAKNSGKISQGAKERLQSSGWDAK